MVTSGLLLHGPQFVCVDINLHCGPYITYIYIIYHVSPAHFPTIIVTQSRRGFRGMLKGIASGKWSKHLIEYSRDWPCIYLLLF